MRFGRFLLSSSRAGLAAGLLASLGTAGGATAAAKGNAAKPAAPAKDEPPAADAVDIASFKDKLKVVSDGKGHYIAIVPFGDAYENFFYGDGKSFWLQRVIGGGSMGTESFDRSIWEPRHHGGNGNYASFSFKDGKYTMFCSDRSTELKPVAADELKSVLGSAKFWKVRWKRRAYALARDNMGNYYYVDKQREPEENKNFRLFAGPKGSMKPQKMTNVVSDSGGDIFATPKGELRLILNKSETTWIAGKKQNKLLFLPVEDNAHVIYNELGVYAGERLGTPCDDL